MRCVHFAGCVGWSRHAGLTLVELMVSMTLSLFVVLAATSLLLSSKSAYTANDDMVTIQESGRHAIELITRALYQAGHEDWSSPDGARLAAVTDSASINGLDARSLKSTNPAMESPQKKSVNGSDVLGIRFHGAGIGEHGDETILNCAGFGVPSGLSGGASDRGWSIFFVAEDATGEPELRCKYKGKSNWTAVAIARGVESFQVLYGVDVDGDGMANRFLTASELDELDSGLVLAGADAVQKSLDRNAKTHWKKIVVIKVALLMRGVHAARADQLGKSYDLFGKEYGDSRGFIDPGTRIAERSLPSRTRNRLRKTFAATIQLRNRGTEQRAGSPA